MDFRKLSLYKYPILFSLACAALYASFAYDLDRSDFFKLISLYGALFFLSFKLIQFQKHNYWILVSLSLLFRLVFIVALPVLSQDYFRFIWDGRLLANGLNPYEYLPAGLISSSSSEIAQSRQLVEGMGGLSAGNYTNYAPLNQLIFLFAAWLGSTNILFSVILMRIVIIMADFGTLYFGTKLLRSFGLPDHRIFWYMLNPFIIIELTGNLHFEGVMAFFLVWSLYLLHKLEWIKSAVVFGLSVAVKLLPLMFLPILFKYFTTTSAGLHKATFISNTKLMNASYLRDRRLKGLGKLLLYYLLVLAVVIFSFYPFISAEVIRNFGQSVGLWFGKFEFNASIYYLVREIGFWVKGYNIIGTAGKILPLVTFLIILALSFIRQNKSTRSMITSMLFAITAYLLLSTTVHPWYLTIPLLLSIFTEYRYLIVWTALVFLSYFAYSNPEYQENLWLVSLEYLIVLGYFAWELAGKKAEKSLI